MESVHDGRKGPMKKPLTFSNSDSKLECEESESKETKTTWMCSFCVMDFDTKSNLRDHVSSEHKRVILQNCPFCDKTFPTSKALRKHIKYSRSGHRGLKNVKAHKCSFCNEAFSTSNDLVLHTSNFHVCVSTALQLLRKKMDSKITFNQLMGKIMKVLILAKSYLANKA